MLFVNCILYWWSGDDESSSEIDSFKPFSIFTRKTKTQFWSKFWTIHTMWWFFKVALNGYITKNLMSMHKKFIIIIGGGVKINISSRNTNTTKKLIFWISALFQKYFEVHWRFYFENITSASTGLLIPSAKLCLTSKKMSSNKTYHWLDRIPIWLWKSQMGERSI